MNILSLPIIDFNTITPLAAASFFGFILGLERLRSHKVASVRTFSLIAAGSCLFTILSMNITGMTQGDGARIAAQIVTGIGFLGGGVIFKSLDRIEGITTGAMIWFAAAIGMACGLNEYTLAISATIIYFLVILLGTLAHKTLKS